MQKVIGVILLIILLATPVSSQGLDFLSNLLKAVVQEFGIERVIEALEDLGYIGEGEVHVKEKADGLLSATVSELTVRSPIWDDPGGEETLVYMVVSDDSNCYSMVEWGRDISETLADRMYWRQKFISKCIGR